MKPWKINLLGLGVLFLIASLTPNFKTIMGWIIPLSAVWVYLDARKLEIGKYKANLFGRGPISYAWVTLIIWPIALPNYISFRQKIKDGKIPLKASKASA
ncbi:MAG: hypothetical protein ACD_81C00208G0002 [uncultured bacterium]|uniref:Uncharacterized protein n=1 Tax=Candidatus Wolfebacteria bacterium GW2011_GWC2_39_22 TaxID=1619013 RepID=A0A0G0QQN2_9BACT|nr:MAG: hypothetical protein ACD_81C00208G0002 [uncultured bacterium]KKR12680.1 MAG: hypothetical protein UT41_C0001G0224 [Candidatus Wolfebacteria bacterium GW2011_GWC2_39_22]HBI25656.1 hypothetical protein [Candidatus Wolfebacteria bacterium]